MKRYTDRIPIDEARSFATSFFYDSRSYQPNVFHSIWPIDKIPEHKIEDARVTFAPYSQVDEIPLFFYDQGVLAQRGIVITNAAVYYYIPKKFEGYQKGRLPLAEVKKFECVVGLLSNEIKVNDDVLGFINVSKDEALVLNSFVNSIITLFHDEPHAGFTQRTRINESEEPSLDDSNVIKVWEISKSSVMNKEINLDIVRDFVLEQLRQTDIGWNQVESDRVLLKRSGSFSMNRVAFTGALRFAETDSSVGVQLFGSKESTGAVVGGAVDACMLITFCPPMLFCLGGDFVRERKYIERTLEAILEKLAAQIGSKVVYIA